MFGKKKDAESELLARITTSAAKTWDISEFEVRFFIQLEKEIKAAGLLISDFSTVRMGNGGIRINHYSGIIGTVHLRKKFGSLQYFIDALNNHDMQDAPLEACIATIPYLIDYTKLCIKTHKKALSV